MNKKLIVAAAAVSLGLLGLAGCASTPASTPAAGAGGGGGTSQSAAAPSLATHGSATAALALAAGTSSFGPIIVDGRGMTVYVFDNDTANSGKSSCQGDCLVKWPPVISQSDAPQLTGITGKAGVIILPDGSKQVTMNGLPLYYFASDTAAGDVKGQGVGGIWWLVSPNGDKLSAGTGSTGGY